MSSQNRRTHDEAFFDEDDDDDWIFDPALDQVMIQTGGGSSTRPLLEFELRPVGARRNWRNVLNKQRFEATLRQHRDVTPRDNLGQELTHALQRSIEQQIAQDPTLTPNSTVHFTMQSSAFTHAFQSTTFTVREFEEGSERLDTYLQSFAAKLNSNEEFTPDDTFTMETTFIRTPGRGRGNGKRYKPSCAAVRGIVKRSRVTIKNKDNLLLRSRYRHHESPGRCEREFARPKLPQSQTGATRPRVIGQRTPPSSPRPRRTLWHSRTGAVSGRVTWVPTQGSFHRSTAHAHLRWTRTHGQGHSPHQRRQSLRRM